MVTKVGGHEGKHKEVIEEGVEGMVLTLTWVGKEGTKLVKGTKVVTIKVMTTMEILIGITVMAEGETRVSIPSRLLSQPSKEVVIPIHSLIG